MLRIKYAAAVAGFALIIAVTNQPVMATGSHSDRCEGKNAIVGHSFTINGVADIDNLDGLKQGDSVSMQVELRDECEDVKVGLASYTTPKPTFSVPQEGYDHAVATLDKDGTVGPILVPTCYHQTDAFYGSYIAGEALTAGERYGDRKIDWKNGGTDADCTVEAQEPETPVEEPEEPTEEPEEPVKPEIPVEEEPELPAQLPNTGPGLETSLALSLMAGIAYAYVRTRQ